MIAARKEKAVLISWATLTSVAGSLAAVWAFASPLAQQALAGEIQKQLAPLVIAQVITLQSTVKNLQNQIAALEFKRDMCGHDNACWTVRDAQDLAAARNDLTAAQHALDVLAKAN
jgi:hypothetical protein